MQSKIILLIILGLAIGAALIGGYYYIAAPNKESAEPESTLSFVSPTPEPVEFIDYEDDAGFTFTYPDSVSVVPLDLNDSYAHIELVSDEFDGSVEIHVTDTIEKSDNAWISSNIPRIDTKDIDEIAFGDITASEIASEGGILTVAYDQGALFRIDTKWEDDPLFWHDVYDAIITSFAFLEIEEEAAAPAPVSSGGGSSSSDILFEGEEIF